MTTLSTVNDIEVITYPKGCMNGLHCHNLSDMVVLSIDGSNVTCTIGGITEQTITKASALKYINCHGGYIE